MKWLDWLKGEGERRHVKRATRYVRPGLTAFYWNGAAPIARPVKDVSMTGAYFYTEEEWYPGTVLDIALKQDEEGAEGAASVFARCQVVRSGPDGIGVRFMVDKNGDRKKLERFIAATAMNQRLSDALRKGGSSSGASLVEFALLLPLLLFLLLNAVNFAYFIYAWIGVANVARSAGDYAILGGSSAGLPTPPTVAKLTALIAADVASLPNANSTNPNVSICRNVNGTAVAIIGTCSSPPQDPEVQVGTQTYTNVSVDITYTFTPLVSSFDLAGLGMPVFPATIHRRAVMRLIQ